MADCHVEESYGSRSAAIESCSPYSSPSTSKRSLTSRLRSAGSMGSKRSVRTEESRQLEEGAATARVLEELSAEEQANLRDDGEVLRYVRACNCNVQEALKRLRATFAWRRIERPEELTCTVCERDPHSHFMHVVGHDQLGRPVIYSCLANVTDRKTEHNKMHMIATFEQAIRLMPPGVSQWVWVSDFNGFGMSDVDPAIARIFLHVSAEHYPERLGHFYVVDPPRVFSWLWKAIQSWVDPVTRSKVSFTGKPGSAVDAVFKQQLFSNELVAWLRVEMQENRDSRTIKSKVYSYRTLEELARHPASPMKGGSTHSVYGTNSLLQYIRKRPEVLDAAPSKRSGCSIERV